VWWEGANRTSIAVMYPSWRLTAAVRWLTRWPTLCHGWLVVTRFPISI